MNSAVKQPHGFFVLQDYLESLFYCLNEMHFLRFEHCLPSKVKEPEITSAGVTKITSKETYFTFTLLFMSGQMLLSYRVKVS